MTNKGGNCNGKNKGKSKFLHSAAHKGVSGSGRNDGSKGMERRENSISPFGMTIS